LKWLVRGNQRERDYIAKRSQYRDCGIPEYWIVDPQTQTILVLELRGNTYTEIGNFSNDDLVKSSVFGQLNLKVSQVFILGRINPHDYRPNPLP
jgi:Uma2 family endonuclease